MSSRDLARMALEREMVRSTAGDPVLSIASTIEKNIREGTYNRPALVFVRTVTGRQVALPNWKPQSSQIETARGSVSVKIPDELAEKVSLAKHAGIAPSFDATVAYLLRKGLAAAAPDVRAAMIRRLDALDRVGS